MARGAAGYRTIRGHLTGRAARYTRGDCRQTVGRWRHGAGDDHLVIPDSRRGTRLVAKVRTRARPVQIRVGRQRDVLGDAGVRRGGHDRGLPSGQGMVHSRTVAGRAGGVGVVGEFPTRSC